MCRRLIIFLECVSFLASVIGAPKINITPNDAVNRTIITAREIPQGRIEYKVIGKRHNLYVGRCKLGDSILHQENIILNNDGKSHVAAGIRVNVEAPVSISCVNIFDEVPDGAGGYPQFVAGGPGHNFIEFTVTTDYGKGFHFFVQILGEDVKPSQQ